MSLSTFSKFYFDFQVNIDQLYISFNEGSGEILAPVDVGNYSITNGISKVQSAMTDNGTQAYTVSFDRSTRLVTISAASNFSLLVSSSTVTTTLFQVLGFTGSDRTGASSYTGNLPCGSQYLPQFVLQDYIAKEHYVKSVDATIKKTATGQVEVVRFGTEAFIQANIKYATNKRMDNGVIKNNPSGVEDLAAFMSFAIQKQPMELMLDASTPATFIDVILEKTPADSNGTGFQLKELYDKNLPGFFETGVLLFRVME